MNKKEMDSISSKTFVGERSMYGVRGKEYNKKLYQISKAKIGAMTFSPPRYGSCEQIVRCCP